MIRIKLISLLFLFFYLANSCFGTEINIEELVKGKYITSALTKPEADCNYTSEGDLTSGGKIKCARHGNGNR